ncbi:MAG: DNA cytosine methyltransferase [Bacilli bacterium]|nr:DNA cytosine methyltransferase [Bacilli bacterium]MDD4282909.1 DNA cytosine methyltransferase [Bacilli bacterium]MDD4719105.1 DNA cytosine methyltransferase [Bacilli bacterium]
MKQKKFKFIDLFSGIGGFHNAMVELGGECVFASEIDKYAIETYRENYHIESDYDITKVDEKKIPYHDVLCAGFPCQTFSKAGKQEGMNDTRGTLFFEIERILKYHKTKYIVLENVRNLVSHDKGNTWNTIHGKLKELGYRLTPKPLIISPHQLGIPQLRERVVILGIYDPKNSDKNLNIEFKDLLKKDDNTIYNILDGKRAENKYYISDYEKMVLTAWDKFYKGIKTKVIGFPIWAVWFNGITKPSDLPKWKTDFIDKNQKLYSENKEFIDSWLKEYNNLKDFVPTHKKMEWQAGDTINSLWEGIIQFRPSGIRVKSPNCFPALVAMVQVPIIGKYKRRLTVREAARLQSFPEKFVPNNLDYQAYKQFGNAVNVEVIKYATTKLFEYKD